MEYYDYRKVIELRRVLKRYFNLSKEDIPDFDDLYKASYKYLHIKDLSELYSLLNTISFFLVGLRYPNYRDSHAYFLHFEQELQSYKTGG